MKLFMFWLIGVWVTPAFARDLSNFEFSVTTFSTSTYAHLLVMDPAGRQTGRLAFTGRTIKNIPGSSYGTEAIGHAQTRTPGTERAEFFARPIVSGTYTLVLFGSNSAHYSLNLIASDSSGILARPTPGFLEGFLTASSTRQYVLQYDPTPGAPKSVVKVVTFDTLGQDFQTARQLGMIDNDGILNSFLQKLDAAQQQAAASATRPAAINILQALVNEMNAQSGKHMTAQAAGILTGDIQTLIAKLSGG